MFFTIDLIYPFNKMILGSPELDKFIVDPSMKLEPFDPKLIKKIQPNHPYKLFLFFLYKYYPSYSCSSKKNDADPDQQGYEDVTDFYFRLLDDYYRYGVTFDRKWNILPDGKLGVLEEEDFGKKIYSLIKNYYKRKAMLFNKIKTIDLKELDRGDEPILEKEKQKRDLIKKQTNKKLQVALMDPDVYRSVELMKDAIKKSDYYIEQFNHRMSWWGIKEFSNLEYDIR